MIEKLDRKAVIRAAMPAGDEAFDDMLGNQFHVANTRESRGVEEAGLHLNVAITFRVMWPFFM